jgi:hypothetical protein
MLDAAQYLADHIHEAPVWIVPCGTALPQSANRREAENNATSYMRQI